MKEGGGVTGKSLGQVLWRYRSSWSNVQLVSDEESDDNNDYFLTDEVLADLRSYYVSSMPEYKQLLQLYEQEKRRAKSSHHLRKFPSFSEWQPTESLEVRSFNRSKHFSRKDPHGCVVKFSTMESDQDYSAFGRILMIFYHTFLSNTTVCIMV